MIASEFDEVNVRIAENQPEFETLPALYDSSEGTMVYCFELSDEEKKTIFDTGKIWFKQWTGGGNFQPIMPSVNKGDLIQPKNLGNVILIKGGEKH